MSAPEHVHSHMRKLLAALPQLPMLSTGAVDFDEVDSELMLAIASDAETTVRVLHHGVGAIGHLLAHSAVVIEDGTISADCIESLGFFLAELADLGAGCMTLAVQCKRSARSQQPQLHELATADSTAGCQ